MNHSTRPDLRTFVPNQFLLCLFEGLPLGKYAFPRKMKTDARESQLGSFVVYTSLGYLSLALHHWVFFPSREAQATDIGLFLMLANLVVGGLCFWKGFQGSVAWWRSIRDDST